jgi:hypothetical protein
MSVTNTIFKVNSNKTHAHTQKKTTTTNFNVLQFLIIPDPVVTEFRKSNT